MKNRVQLLSTFILAAATGFSCKPASESNLNLVNGKLDNEGLFPSVVQTAVTIGQTADGKVEAKCTASIISSQVVLTAAHCVTVDGKDPTEAIDGELLVNKGAFGNPYTSSNSRVRTLGFGSNSADFGIDDPYASGRIPTSGIGASPATSADVVIGEQRISNGRVVIHPSYTGNSGPDVAVVIFPEGTFKDHKHMKVASGADNYPKEGLEVMIVGFGKTDQFDPDSGGEKRYGKNVLTRVGSTLDFQGQTRTSTADGTNVFNSQGDSGGPMISNSGASKGMIIGVSSTQNQVNKGDTQGEGHYANLLEESSEAFLAQYTKEGQTIDLPSIDGSSSGQPGRQNDLLAEDDRSPQSGNFDDVPQGPNSRPDSYNRSGNFGPNSYFHNNGCYCQ